MIDLNQLCKFLVKAKKAGYASGDKAQKIVEKDQSTTLVFEEGDWKYHDNYFGGEPYGGREVVFYRDSPIYIMTYYGWVDKKVTDINTIYKVLQEALFLIPEDKPFRGPKVYRHSDLIYDNDFEGEINRFSGLEIIRSDDGTTLYQARYAGGLVDQRQ